MKDKIKMIVSDLDETLLDKNSEITQYTQNILEECRRRGIKIVFATARPIRSVNIFFTQIQPDAFICHNGAVISFENGQIERIGIKYNVSMELIKDLLSTYPDVELAIEINDIIHSNYDVRKTWPEKEYIYTDFSNLTFNEADKILFNIIDNMNIESIKQFIPDDLYLEFADDNLGMVMNKDATKLNAILKICNLTNISIENVVSFGDSYNDMDMVKNCGIGVAVANALEDVKKVADYICDEHGNDGVGKWIDANLLIQ